MWTIHIPNWCPPSVNVARGRHFAKSHKSTQEVCEYVTVYNAKVGAPKVRPDYRPVRIVKMIVQKIGKLPDRDNLLKHTLDGLTRAGLIVDDSAKWCRWHPPVVRNPEPGSKKQYTAISLEDAVQSEPALTERRRMPTRQEIYEALTQGVQGSKFAALADQLWDAAEEVRTLNVVAPWPDFTRARVVVRPYHYPHDKTSSSHGDFYLHYMQDGSEEVWVSQTACYERQLARLVKWAEGLGLRVDREGDVKPIDAAPVVLPDPELFG